MKEGVFGKVWAQIRTVIGLWERIDRIWIISFFVNFRIGQIVIGTVIARPL